MPKKTLGVVQLGWRCPNCRTLNPGTEKTCTSCGNPQPENVAFENMPQQELKTDADSLAKAKKGADIHCPYCGARNPADAKVCSQCSGDLVGGAKRKSGEVVGAFQKGPVEKKPCPNCGTPNLPNAARCTSCGAILTAEKPSDTPGTPQSAGAAKKRSPMLIAGVVGLGMLLLCGCVAIIFMLTRTNEVTGTVSGYEWSRSITVEQLQPVQRNDWRDSIPSDASLGQCDQRVNRTQDYPEGNYQEVCGTPYTVDTGTGLGEVVQDCVYEIYEDYCTYTVTDWAVVNTYDQSGQDQNPFWPQLSLTTQQRAGEQSESYTIYFDTTDGLMGYSTASVTEFQSFPLGSVWLLEVNAFGKIDAVQPE